MTTAAELLAEVRSAKAARAHQTNSWHAAPPDPLDDAPPIGNAAEPQRIDVEKTRLAHWLRRDLPVPDPILGSWLTTTSRVLLFAPTGIGKTMLGIGMALPSAAGKGFLHWGGSKPRSVLYIDGEMSARLLKKRLADEVHRFGEVPSGMHVFSHEDIDNFAPLNTREGQQSIDCLIRDIGGVDLALFDNVMSLIGGDQKDEEGWRQTLPWIRLLTARSIGQVWTHHTGHDESRSYGTKVREWQMDTVIKLEPVEHDQTDVSFRLSFAKARERTPENRHDFVDVDVALINDAWCAHSTEAGRKAKISPLAVKFLGCLVDACTTKVHSCPAASIEDWQAECVKRGVIETGKPDSQRSLFSKYKRELIAANHVACDTMMAWVL